MAKFRKGEEMKKIIKQFSTTFAVLTLMLVIMLITFVYYKHEKQKPQSYNDVTFEVIDTYDSAGNNLIYDAATGIVYKGGYSAYKPYYSEDGYLYIYRDGRLQEVR